EMQDGLVKLVGEYCVALARSYYQPFIHAHLMLLASIEKIERREGGMYLGGATKVLAEMLGESIVPDVYFSLGDRIHHFLIDEFQDTSPVQWSALRPLIENSLGGRGSL